MPNDLAPPPIDAPENAQDAPDAPTAPEPLDPKKVVDTFKRKIEAATRNRRHFTPEWKHSIDLRLGRADSVTLQGAYDTGEEERSLVNPDWAMTKTKTANLYSQVPAVQCTHENSQYAAAIPPFAKALNYEIGEKRSRVGVCMEESLNDVVNASGIGAVIVSYAARFETVEVPAIDTSQMPPDLVQQLQQSGQMPMQSVERVTDYKFPATRISSGALLWPTEFIGSDFDDGDWVGHTAQAPWPVAKVDLKLTEDQKDAAVGGGEKPSQDDLRVHPDRSSFADAELVTYDELFYWRYRVDPDEKSFKAIWRLVFVHGIPDPVVHEPWKGQRYDPERRTYIGNCRFPIRILTVTYVSDNPIPPSDSAAGRPQVNDMRRSRSQMFMNRDRSRPLRWYDVNRIDPLIQDSLMRGTWQAMIPTNGDGSRSIGEIARASYPSEDLEFDRQTKQDLMESWQIGPNQMGSTGAGITATESDNVQANFSTRIGQEKNQVAKFFLGICEVIAGFMCLYSDFPTLSDQERQTMQQAWDQQHILHDLVLKIRPDSQVVLDVAQQIKRRIDFLNFAGKSGLIDPAPVIAEIAELSGLDPSVVMKKPEPPPPQEPNISWRFSGKDDLVNPLAMAMLVHLKKAPSLEDLAEAQKIQQAAAVPVPPLPAAAGPPGVQPSAPGGPAALPPPNGQEAPPPLMGSAHPEWTLPERISKRSGDGAPEG